jgi:hypothetical protein
VLKRGIASGVTGYYMRLVVEEVEAGSNLEAWWPERSPCRTSSTSHIPRGLNDVVLEEIVHLLQMIPFMSVFVYISTRHCAARDFRSDRADSSLLTTWIGELPPLPDRKDISPTEM